MSVFSSAFPTGRTDYTLHGRHSRLLRPQNQGGREPRIICGSGIDYPPSGVIFFSCFLIFGGQLGWSSEEGLWEQHGKREKMEDMIAFMCVFSRHLLSKQ
ncbi:hypothetical protein P152DRAFT_16888 [Eremomyces bilateralis CBS 781.70]|uniref:Uncharacterized protein n=1 Tax=Eremomyces bilateralis CBS 781.70 TaxID=1392243 RepID=A0A6G1GH19_9PEZI|nr:uncharacterized protein P152DRAFT_16888 [Eremomyces bilateralis CBS 781.70]KAF1817368.1 hypothetical protein P152DRAFT_16888 [Eremomyces bilateralis CBS 781.70]